MCHGLGGPPQQEPLLDVQVHVQEEEDGAGGQGQPHGKQPLGGEGDVGQGALQAQERNRKENMEPIEYSCT